MPVSVRFVFQCMTTFSACLSLLHIDSAPPHHSWNRLLLPLCSRDTEPLIWPIIPCSHLTSSEVVVDWLLCPQGGVHSVVQIRHKKSVVIHRTVKESLTQPRVKEGFLECVLYFLRVTWGMRNGIFRRRILMSVEWDGSYGEEFGQCKNPLPPKDARAEAELIPGVFSSSVGQQCDLHCPTLLAFRIFLLLPALQNAPQFSLCHWEHAHHCSIHLCIKLHIHILYCFPHDLLTCYSPNRHERKQSGHACSPGPCHSAWHRVFREGVLARTWLGSQQLSQHPTQLNFIPR